MDITYSHVAGLDVHKRTVVACIILSTSDGTPRKQIRTFSTVTADLLALADWLAFHGVTHVAMESTGEFWKPLYNLLEASFTVLVVNAQHIKTVPGRKTDVKDAEWIADLLRHGLLNGSFIPPLPQRDLRDLTRQRTNLVHERVRVINQLQKVLEWANIKLSSVVSDVLGVSARAMLVALVQGEDDQQVLAGLGAGRLRSKQADLERALEGRVRDHHRFMLAQHLIHIDFLDEQMGVYDQQIMLLIEGHVPPPASPSSEQTENGEAGNAATTTAASEVSWERAVELLDSIPGVSRKVAEQIIAEVGTDMTRFASEGHLASWAKVCPGNNESAGKRRSGRTGSGNRWLKSMLVQAAWASVKMRETHLSAVYRRLALRRGKQKAIMAVAHRILVAVYHMLKDGVAYREYGNAEVPEGVKRKRAERMQRQIERLGYSVVVQTPASATA